MHFLLKLYYVVKYIPYYSIPNQTEDRFTTIDFNLLKKNGIKYIISDIDQTLLPQSSNQLSVDVCRKIEEVKTIFGKSHICFITNEPSTQRTASFLKQVSVDTIDTQGYQKPSPFTFNQAMLYFNDSAKANEVCFIGDRIWTDIIGANNVNMYTIKVAPYDINSDRDITKIMRIFENMLTNILTFFFRK
jgi:HAD superfamily phosphatase (TIGR01668 family)